MKDRSCPSCREPMPRREFERKPLGRIEVEVCFGCHALWFDQHESVQLTPGAVLQLFRLIHEHPEKPTRPLADFPQCPACNKTLKLTQDMQRHNRISYYRCPDGPSAGASGWIPRRPSTRCWPENDSSARWRTSRGGG